MKMRLAGCSMALFLLGQTQAHGQWLDSQWKKTIVLFEQADSDTSFAAIGTGFLVAYENRMFIVTNQHIAVEQNLYARFNLKAQPIKSVRCSIDSVVHASGIPWETTGGADLAVLPLLVYPELALHVIDLDIVGIGLSRFRSWDTVNEGDDIYVLGFPMRIGSGDHYAPVVRSGVVALKEQPGKFLIDANIYPGNSGGPVFTRSSAFDYRTRTLGGSGESGYLIGIVSAYLPYTDVAISPQTHHVRVTFEENSGLAVVYSADQIEACVRSWVTEHER